MSQSDSITRISVIISPNIIEHVEKYILERESEFFAAAFRFDRNCVSVSLEEPNYGPVLCWLMNCLNNEIQDENKTDRGEKKKPENSKRQQRRQREIRCLDTIFDCLIMCNKYSFNRLEQALCELFCKQLRILSTNVNNPLDPIPPERNGSKYDFAFMSSFPSSTAFLPFQFSSSSSSSSSSSLSCCDSRCCGRCQCALSPSSRITSTMEQYLNAYEIYLLAKEFNLTILASQIQSFIQHKRSEARNRLRMAFL